MAAIAEQKPQLVFLDIELQSETSFEILEKLPEINFELVFTTAFDHYALKAIKFCAIDYLLKPIDLNELRIAVSKAEKRLNREYLNKNLEVLLHNIKSGSQKNHRIALSTLEGLLFVNVNDIIYCGSSVCCQPFNKPINSFGVAKIRTCIELSMIYMNQFMSYKFLCFICFTVKVFTSFLLQYHLPPSNILIENLAYSNLFAMCCLTTSW